MVEPEATAGCETVCTAGEIEGNAIKGKDNSSKPSKLRKFRSTSKQTQLSSIVEPVKCYVDKQVEHFQSSTFHAMPWTI